MPANTFSTELAGVNLAATYASVGVAPFSLGVTTMLNDGGRAVFVCSSISAVSTFAAVVIAENYKVNMLTNANGPSGGRLVAFAQTSIATGYCGWVQYGGRPKVNLSTNCAPFVQLYTGTVAGNLDDATVSGSGGMIVGVFAAVSISNATAATCISGVAPHVQVMVGS